MDKFTPLYPYSREEARKYGEMELWRESFGANCDCKLAIEAAIRRDFDGMHLKPGCAESVIEEFGYKRTAWVLANTLRELSYDGRFSPNNQDWGKRRFIPADEAHNYQFTVTSHPAVLDGFINDYRRAVMKLGLFDREQCVPNSGDLNYEGKVLVLSPQVLREECWKQSDQIWYLDTTKIYTKIDYSQLRACALEVPNAK